MRARKTQSSVSSTPLKVLIGSVRAGHFTGPLDAAASSFYDLFARMAKADKSVTCPQGGARKVHFGYFNAVPSNEKPKANLKDLEEADVFMIVVENEFQYANNKINPMYRQYLDDRLKKIRQLLPNKTIVGSIVLLHLDHPHSY